MLPPPSHPALNPQGGRSPLNENIPIAPLRFVSFLHHYRIPTSTLFTPNLVLYYYLVMLLAKSAIFLMYSGYNLNFKLLSLEIWPQNDDPKMMIFEIFSEM